MEKLTPEKVMAMLRKKGTELSVEQADSILKFLRMLADGVVSNHLQKIQNDNAKLPEPSKISETTRSL